MIGTFLIEGTHCQFERESESNYSMTMWNPKHDLRTRFEIMDGIGLPRALYYSRRLKILFLY